ncbi:hypothetical protein LJC42_03505 [Eubacteriales bacterium OttesenSCG-928-K08]|nr:hypothetical protein [Eubacteriales bacterium OttesenSCG-928-K08]
MKRNDRFFTLLLVMLLCLTQAFPALAATTEAVEDVLAPAEETKPALYISSADEFLVFAENCTLDAYSEGLSVYLTSDIDLGAFEFAGVPLFCGNFNGQGHSIKGVTLSQFGSQIGLFRQLTQTAVVENLTLYANVSPEGSGISVGLIAGTNAGKIVNCTAYGTLNATQNLGGIAGLNSQTGIIRNCENQASITGETSVGGIVGKNEGALFGNKNYGGINSTNMGAGSLGTPNNTGGIAGWSCGSINNCINYGVVGYSHVGYNTGGIIGLHSGVARGNKNHGEVYGRKDIGGIVGQFDPMINLEYAPSALEELGSELSVLFDDLDALTNATGNAISGAVNDLMDVKQALNGLIDTTADGLNDELSHIHTSLDSALDQLGYTSRTINELVRDIRAYSKAMRDAMEQIRNAIDLLRKQAAPGSEAAASLDALEQSINAVDSSLLQMEADAKALDEFSSDISAINKSSDPADIDSLDTAKMERYAQNTAKPAQTIAKELAHAQSALASLQASSFAAGAADVIEAIQQIADAISRMVIRTAALIRSLPTRVSTVNNSLSSTGNVLRQYMDEASVRNKKVTAEIDAQLTLLDDFLTNLGNTVLDANSSMGHAMRKLTRQMDNVSSALTGLGKVPELTIDDISIEQAYSQTDGLIADCFNYALINGDVNVGGVAGNMGYELSLDPEQDWDLGGTSLTSATAFIRATLINSKNYGAVSAKNESGGGIVGREDIGAVIGCTNIADVEVQGGSYCGGIVGLSRSTIRESYAQATLTGSSYVGGIAGKAQHIFGCYSMVLLQCENAEAIGSIAGLALGDVAENYFPEESAPGIDGVNYAGKAQPLSYAEFINTPDLPESFRSLQVLFMVEGQTVESFSIPFGGELDDALIPECPEKDGQYGAWAKFDRENIKRSQIIEAVYAPLLKTASSGGAQPELLAEGLFTSDVKIELSGWNGEENDPLLHNYSVIKGYTFKISDGHGAYSSPVTLRVRAENIEKDVMVLRQTTSTVDVVEAKFDGSYLVFEMPENGSFLIMTKKPAWWLDTIAIVVFLLLVLVFFVVRKRRKKQSASKSDNANISL